MIQKKSIVFIQTAFIGDLFLSLPTLERIKKRYPDHELILICKKGLSEFFITENKVDIAYEVEKTNSESYANALLAIKKHNVQIVICPHRSFRSAMFAFKIKSPLKIGFSKIWNRLIFNKVVTYQKSWPDVIRQMNILSPIDSELHAEIKKKDWAYLNIKKADGYFEEIPKIFSFSGCKIKSKETDQKQLIAIFPGSVWKTKQWTTQGFSDVAGELLRKNKAVIILGGASEKVICDEIQQKNPTIQNFCGQLSLYESILKIKECDYVICNDSAPAHMAACLGVSVIAVFGPTTVNLGFRPWSNKSVVVENLNLNCRPCGAHGHNVCPLGHHKCMTELKSSAVLKYLI